MPILSWQQGQTRITGNDIPDDVWRTVARHISPSRFPNDLMPIMSINRTFFNVALDSKYREVRWIKVDHHFVQLLERLKEPIISRHVKRLFIRAWFVDYLLKRDELFDPPVKNKLKQWLYPFTSYIASMPSKRTFEKRRHLNKVVDIISSKDIIHSMIRAVNGMTNVIELDFEWRDLPLNPKTQIFLISTRTAFSTSLRKLVLRAEIAKFKELLTITNFDNLEELDFKFDFRTNHRTVPRRGSSKPTPGQDVDLDPDIEDLLQTIIPFINHRKSHLRSLSISSLASTDLSSFFNALPPESLSRLRCFGAHVYFNKKHLSDPSGLLRFLKVRAPTLLQVSLEANGSDQENLDPVSRRRLKIAEWSPINDEFLSHPSYLSGLESLVVPYVSPRKTIPLVRRSSETLTRLSLTDHYLSLDEVDEVVGIFSHRPFELQHLHIEVTFLNALLIHKLAARLPGLFALVLVFQTSLSEDFLDHASLEDWKLVELDVHEGRYKSHSLEDPSMTSVSYMLEYEIMRRISSRVPTIRVLKGVPIR